jgi:hypothetical protein
MRSAARRRRTGALVAGAVVVVAAVGIAVGTSPGSRPAPSSTKVAGRSPGSAVLTAIDSTLGARTADLYLSVHLTVPGAGQVTADGDGQIDFADNASTVTVVYRGMSELGGMSMTELYAGGSGYLSMSELGAIVPGKTWIALPVGGSSVAPGASDPATMFQVLRSQGAQVTPLGASQVDGAAVDGYHVVIGPAAVAKRLSQSDLPAGLAEAATSMFGSGGITMDVYVNSSNDMVQRVATQLSLTVAGRTVSGQAVEDTSNFGTPVSITPPPADQVASFQQFEQAAASVAGSSSPA